MDGAASALNETVNLVDGIGEGAYERASTKVSAPLDIVVTCSVHWTLVSPCIGIGHWRRALAPLHSAGKWPQEYAVDVPTLSSAVAHKTGEKLVCCAVAVLDKGAVGRESLTTGHVQPPKGPRLEIGFELILMGRVIPQNDSDASAGVVHHVLFVAIKSEQKFQRISIRCCVREPCTDLDVWSMQRVQPRPIYEALSPVHVSNG
jgi:hypothetical protein